MQEPAWRRITKSFQERFLTDVEVAISDSRTVTVHQSLDPDMPVWDAALVLAYYLMIQPPSFLSGKRVLELGSGCALVSLVCATCNANVIVTDLAMMLPLIQSNIDANLTKEEKARTQIQELRWGTDVSHLNPPVDYIVASDCVYTVQYFADLAQSLEDLSGPSTRIYLANEHRWKDVDNWWTEELLRRGFTIEEIPLSEHHPIYRHPLIKIFCIVPPAEKTPPPKSVPLVDDEGQPLGPKKRIVYY